MITSRRPSRIGPAEFSIASREPVGPSMAGS
jgi:hypothetical protein